jgi:hypothetical protein
MEIFRESACLFHRPCSEAEIGKCHRANHLPNKPETSLLRWLKTIDIAVVREDGSGFQENANGQFTKTTIESLSNFGSSSAIGSLTLSERTFLKVLDEFVHRDADLVSVFLGHCERKCPSGCWKASR